MASREAAKRVLKQVKPILSTDKEEARKRVLNLYKAWYRQIPYIGEKFKNSFSEVLTLLCHNFYCCDILYFTQIFSTYFIYSTGF